MSRHSRIRPRSENLPTQEDSYQVPKLLTEEMWFYGLKHSEKPGSTLEEGVVRAISEQKNKSLAESLEFAVKKKKGVTAEYLILLGDENFIPSLFVEQHDLLEIAKSEAIKAIESMANNERENVLTSEAIEKEYKLAWVEHAGSKKLWDLGQEYLLEAGKLEEAGNRLGDMISQSRQQLSNTADLALTDLPLAEARKERKLDQLQVDRNAVVEAEKQAVADVGSYFEQRLSSLRDACEIKLSSLRDLAKTGELKKKKDKQLLAALEDQYKAVYGETYKEPSPELEVDASLIIDIGPYQDKVDKKKRRFKKRYALAAGAVGVLGGWEATRGQVLECIGVGDRPILGCVKDGGGDMLFDAMRFGAQKSGFGIEWIPAGYIDADQLEAKYESDQRDPTELLERIDRMLEVAKMLQARADVVRLENAKKSGELESQSQVLYEQIEAFMFERLTPQQSKQLLEDRWWANIFSGNPDFKDRVIVNLSENEAMLELDPEAVKQDHLKEALYLARIKAAPDFATLVKSVPVRVEKGSVLGRALEKKVKVLGAGTPLFSNYDSKGFEFVMTHFERGTIDPEVCGASSNADCLRESVEDILGFKTLAEYRQFEKDFSRAFSLTVTSGEEGALETTTHYDPNIFSGKAPISGAIIRSIELRRASEWQDGYVTPVGFNMVVTLLGCPKGDIITSKAGVTRRKTNSEGEESVYTHNGYDKDCISPKELEEIPVFAALGGTLKFSGWGDSTNLRSRYGNLVEVEAFGESGAFERYAHLDSIAPGLEEKTEIKVGDFLGFMGSTGRDDYPQHLHFESNTENGRTIFGGNFSLEPIEGQRDGVYQFVYSGRPFEMPGLVDNPVEFNSYLWAKRQEYPDLRADEIFVTIGLLNDQGFHGANMRDAADKLIKDIYASGKDVSAFGSYYQVARELKGLSSIEGRQLEIIVGDGMAKSERRNWFYDASKAKRAAGSLEVARQP